MSESISLAESLPIEQARVREIIIMYRDPSLRGSGELAARMMELSLRNADAAVMSGDVVAMLAAYEDLRWYGI